MRGEKRRVTENLNRRLIIGISGASGAIYGIRLLEVLRTISTIETHLIVTKAGERTIIEETDFSVGEVKALASVVHSPANVGASIASGSFRTAGMIVMPCSMHTVSAIAYCQSDNLLTRAADVILKEGRKLVLVVRETPLHRGHLKSLWEAAETGAIILPPVPAFYGRPKTLDDIINHTVGRVLDLVGVEHDLLCRWGDSPAGRGRT